MKYPSVLILAVLAVVGYVIFSNPIVIAWGEGFGSNAYFVSFFAGILFSAGITSPFGAGLWSILNPSNLLLAVFCGALGAVVVDLFLLRFIQEIVRVTITNVKKSKALSLMEKMLNHPLGKIIVPGTVFAFAGFVRAIPFPYKLGDILIRSILDLKWWQLAIMSLIIYTIFALFFIGLKYVLVILL